MLQVLHEAVGAGVAHLVTRETGQVVRTHIARMLGDLDPGTVVTLDFTGIGVVDYSFADECLAKLLTRLIAGEYGLKYVRLAGLGTSQRENVQVALERKRLAALLVRAGDSWDCLGSITPHLRETLAAVMSRGQTSARDLTGLLDLELTASSTRLGALHRQRLVRRRERSIEEGGREFVYEGLIGAAEGEGGAVSHA